MSTLRIFAAISFSLLLVTLNGCETTTSGGVVGAERKQLMLVSSQQLEQMAAQAYTQLRADASKKGALNTDPAMTARVRAIANRIIPHTAVFRPDAPGWKWEVNVINSNELNAFCMPGGKIMFYAGLIRQLSATDDEIAIVMGHEIAHALREHSREQVSQAIAAQTAIGIGAAIFGLGEGSAQLAGAGYEALIASRFSRNDENEADRYRTGARSAFRLRSTRRSHAVAEDDECEQGRPAAGIPQLTPGGSQPCPADRVAAADRDAAVHGRASTPLNRCTHSSFPISGVPRHDAT